MISQQNLAELSCSSGVPSLLRRHTVFAEYLVGLFNFAVVKSNVVSLKNDFVDFKGDLYNFLEDIKFFYIWAVDLEVRVGPKYIRSDVVMADEGENLLFFWICQKSIQINFYFFMYLCFLYPSHLSFFKINILFFIFSYFYLKIELLI